jgi:hypothetical protein
MDIMMPDLNEQAAPAPWLVRRSHVDLPALVQAALARNPNATTEQVVEQLAQWNIQAPGTVVAILIGRQRRSA